MKVITESYPGEVRRPTPIVRSEINGELLVFLTNWGSSEASDQIIKDLSQYISSSVSDVEVTRAFDANTALPSDVNHLRIATLLSNQNIFRSFNKTDIKVGFELTLLLHRENRLSWLSCGLPQMWHSSRHQQWNLLATDMELSTELAVETPLPQRILGLEPHCHFHCGQIHFFPGDRLLLLNHSKLQSLQNTAAGITKIKNDIAATDSNRAYWLSMIEP